MITRTTPDPDGLAVATAALRNWQRDDIFQLHPGDIGWFWRFGADATASAVRVWRRGATIVAVGLLDGPGLVRLAIAPEAQQDEEVAAHLTDDLTRVDPDVLGPGKADLEVPTGVVLHDALTTVGWGVGEPWTTLRMDLAEPVEEPRLRVRPIGPDDVAVRAEVQRAAFDGSTFDVDHWHAMAGGPSYREGRCLVGSTDATPVAAITVWSAGPGRPGLIEPMGVHRDHRGRGYGVAITRAGAAALRSMGASRAMVGTPSSNVAAVATYRAAGFTPLGERADRRRGGQPQQ